MTSTGHAIQTFELRKVYNRSKVAVEGLTLQVDRGEVFGFLGPNGAGKTTAIKMLLGLVTPTAGSGFLLGQPIRSPNARLKVGFLPEHFRFHEWMRADEFLDFHSQLYGMSKPDRKARAAGLLDRVGLADAANKRLKTFSKGMLQRIGLAMALLPRPDIVFLDEPTSGLDPLGRLLVRDIIREAREEGTTIFLNSHMLGEVEVTCTRVAFIRRGRVIRDGALEDLSAGLVRVKLRLGRIPDGLKDELAQWGSSIDQKNDHILSLTLPTEGKIPQFNAWLVAQGLDVYSLAPEHITLEDMFVQIMKEEPEAGEQIA